MPDADAKVKEVRSTAERSPVFTVHRTPKTPALRHRGFLFPVHSEPLCLPTTFRVLLCSVSTWPHRWLEPRHVGIPTRTAPQLDLDQDSL